MTRLTEFLPFEVCYEASTGFGRFYELLTAVAVRVAVAHPGLLRLIYRSKKKNDRVDARKLAKLLHVVEVTKVYVPAADIRAWRELITFCKRMMEELETHSKYIRLVEQELLVFSKDSPGVQLLQTIPGVGLRTAETVVAFIDDPHRFPNSKRRGSYFGVMPSQDQSGGTNRLDHITKEGCPVIRAMLTEAVWQAVRRSPTVKSFQQRVQRGEPDRRKISVIATSHYLVRVMWSMLKNGVVWQEQTPAVLAT